MEVNQNSFKAAEDEHQVGKSQRYYQSEVRYLLHQVSSLRKELNIQVSSIIDSQISSIKEGIYDLAEEVDDLHTKLAVTSQEKHDLLQNVKELNDENRQLKASITYPLPNLEGIQKQDSQSEVPEAQVTNKEQMMNLTRSSPLNSEQEKELSNQKGADSTIVQGIKNPSNSKLKDYIPINFSNIHEMVTKLKARDKEIHVDVGNVLPLPADDLSAPECGLMFTESNSKMNIKHSHKCDQCHYTATQSNHVKQHIKDVHDRIKDHKCEFCAYATARKSNLKAHMMSVHKMGEKKFKCLHCPHKTYRKSELMSHIKGVHDNIRDHKCEDCGYAFTNKCNLNKHRKNVHGKDDKTWVETGLVKREPSP